MSVKLRSPSEVAIELAERAQRARLRLNLTQSSLAKRAGVSYGSLKKFEQTGQVSLHSLLKIALILGEIGFFDGLFVQHSEKTLGSLDELLDEKTRKRGRK